MGTDYGIGDSVIDREDENPDEAIVVWQPDNQTINDWEHEKDGETVTAADENPEYDANENLVVVAFRHSLAETWPGWQEAEPDNLFEEIRERDIHLYGFPETRLRSLEPDDLETGWFDELADRLENAGWDVTIKPSELVVERFDEKYWITADGLVEGTGDHRTPLENLVKKEK